MVIAQMKNNFGKRLDVGGSGEMRFFLTTFPFDGRQSWATHTSGTQKGKRRTLFKSSAVK